MRKFVLLVVGIGLLLSGRLVNAVCTVGDTAGPVKISNLTAEVVSSEGLIYRFTAPSDASGLASYDVRYRTVPITALNFATATQVTGEPVPSASGTIEHHNTTGLLPSTAYYMAMKVYDDCGKVSLMSNSISFTTLPAPVKIQVVIGWDPNTETDLAGYEVYYGTKSVSDPTFVQDEYTVDVGNVTNHSMVVDPGTYYIRVKAYNTARVKSLFSNEVIVTP